MKRFLIPLIFILSIPNVLNADDLKYRDGKTFYNVKVVRETDTHYYLMTSDGESIIEKSEIIKVIKKEFDPNKPSIISASSERETMAAALDKEPPPGPSMVTRPYLLPIALIAGITGYDMFKDGSEYPDGGTKSRKEILGVSLIVGALVAAVMSFMPVETVVYPNEIDFRYRF